MSMMFYNAESHPSSIILLAFFLSFDDTRNPKESVIIKLVKALSALSDTTTCRFVAYDTKVF